ncbi:MAG: serine hydrolase domain-containing protein [Stellaceae bacterium]
MSVWGLPRAESPEQVGLSSARLERAADVIRRDVEKKLIPGAVLVIARGGRVGYAEAFGWRDREAGAEMTADAIFRVASMTKPITSVAAMMLSEEGRLEIAAPVANYLPEFAECTIGVERVRARRTMTVQDLLRHTSGLTYGIIGDSPVQAIWREAELFRADQTNAELVTKIARLPLMYEPGTTWEYGHSVDVLGRVVEVVSGQDLADFIDTRISRPLGLRDTGFAAIGERAARIAEPQIGARPPMHYRVTDPARRWAEGGGGAVSTAADYVRFCQMLLNGGELDGIRLLAPKTVALMTSDHLPPNCGYGDTTRERFGALAPVPEMGYGFGLGFAVRTQPGMSPVPGSVGEYFWGGVLGTYFWIDPVEQLIAVLMMVAPDQRLHYRYLSRQLVYAALTRSRGRAYR